MKTKARPRRKYSEEFKVEALQRSKNIGFEKTGRELEISPSVLRRWWKQTQENQDAARVGDKPSYEELEKKVAKLEKELGYVGEINRILKKSTAIFSSSQIAGLK